jgi:trehalose-phosphatase
MKWLLQKISLAGIEDRMASGNRLILFLNYDKILTTRGVAYEPMQLSSDMRELLRELSEVSPITLVIVSDFSLEVIKRLVGFSGIYFIANSGFEISGPDLNVVHSEAKRSIKVFTEINQKLTKELNSMPGVVLENRGLSLFVNFSEARAADQHRVRLLLEEVWTPRMDSFYLREKNHRMVLTPRVGWNKGRAVMFLWNKFASPRRRPLVLYISGEEADDEIYNYMGHEGIGVIVGAEGSFSETKAGYFLKTRNEVKKFLTWCLQLKKN